MAATKHRGGLSVSPDGCPPGGVLHEPKPQAEHNWTDNRRPRDGVIQVEFLRPPEGAGIRVMLSTDL